MTAQGPSGTQFRRAIERRNLIGAEMALRERGSPALAELLDYVVLLAELRPAKAGRAAVRRHGRLETEAPFLSLAKSHLALAPSAGLCAGERDAVEVLRRPLRWAQPVLVPIVD